MREAPGSARILLLGATGQLGRELARALTELGTVQAVPRTVADLAQPDELVSRLRPVFTSLAPTVVVNAAAYTAVDHAEVDVATATAVNATSPGVLAALASASGAAFVHYSTDYVFDGHGDAPWRETDEPRPLGVYGRTKLAGERAVAAACPRHLILRTSWLIGAQGQNFLKTILQLAATRDSLRVVDDQIGAPTSAEWLAGVTVTMLRAMCAAAPQDPRWGCYHVVPSGYTSWNGLARHAVATATRQGRVLALAPDAIVPIPSSAYPLPAPRPLNSRLDTHKVRATFGVDSPDWRVGVDRVLQQLDAEATT